MIDNIYIRFGDYFFKQIVIMANVEHFWFWFWLGTGQTS